MVQIRGMPGECVAAVRKGTLRPQCPRTREEAGLRQLKSYAPLPPISRANLVE